MTTQYKNLINGELVACDKWIDVVNPATEQVIGQVPDCRCRCARRVSEMEEDQR